MENKKAASITKDIEHYFGFLYDKGYKISSAEYSPSPNGSWMVKLESSDFAIDITSDRNFILLELSCQRNANSKNRISIEECIYWMSKGQIVVAPFKGNLAWGKKKQLERLSGLLKEYLDQITFYLNSDLESKIS